MLDKKWYRLINDDLDDIPQRVEQLKSEYWRLTWVFMVVVIVGTTTMGVARSTAFVGIGCFVAITGILGILSMAIMSHNELCLYRMIREIRQHAGNTDTASE